MITLLYQPTTQLARFCLMPLHLLADPGRVSACHLQYFSSFVISTSLVGVLALFCVQKALIELIFYTLMIFDDHDRARSTSLHHEII